MNISELVSALDWIANRGPVDDETAEERAARILHIRAEAGALAMQLKHQLGLDPCEKLSYEPRVKSPLPYRWDPSS